MNNKMIIVTAPSGAGKTTMVKHILKTYSQYISFSVSATTRPRRKGEKNGISYYFMSTEEFKKEIEQAAFAEWEEVYPGKYYGTLKSEISRIWELGKHIIFDIDIHGALSMKKIYGEQALTIFIKPPSLDILIQRLENRATENKKMLSERIERAKEELEYQNHFDTIVVNDNLKTALSDIEKKVQTFLVID